jgi:hypothetical protein
VEKIAKCFRSFAEAEAADAEFYCNLSGKQKLDILLELIERGNWRETPEGFKRVFKITPLARR